MLQKNYLRTLKLFISSFLCVLLAYTASAINTGSPGSDPIKTLVHIKGLTVQERDALVQAFQDDADLHVEFSCVPAGMLVISCTDPSRQDLNSNISDVLGDREMHRFEELTGKDQGYAEQQCSIARNSR